MKIRTNFVSNSSSASFIIHWKYLSYEKGNSIGYVIADVLNINHSGQDEDDGIVRSIADRTRDDEDGHYTTEFYTSMMNDMSDFGEECLRFVASLAVNGKIINAEVKED